ncbi:XRE family transcriptional regulator [Scytonema sp. HK-05]|uniref:helix-turn-helix domain-containing protein n=1 Tax=Scytonema sp. HK-05 TaxID=1137095 RepID=UPI0009366561|nr:helix-turn-helix transcriptional regulator [Scytonema sp. HK-05]OKH58615.1 type I restriction endonuclease subunit S [Scytonema sp. HK-05]BAY48484.1 XRE family transcriptional regulator [Scytonema sp. HK-05]
MRKLFADYLRKARQAHGMSQERLVELAGLRGAYISLVDRGERNILIDNIERIATALDLKSVDLLGRNKEC